MPPVPLRFAQIRDGRPGRFSSWDTKGGNADLWMIQPGQRRVLADIQGPGCIQHIWMTQRAHYRECLLRFTWDNARHPSVVVPLGDFFCLGHSMVNSFENALFAASTRANNQFNQGCAFNCYAPMPFHERAVVEIENQGTEPHRQFFYIDYEQYDDGLPLESLGYFHAEWRCENPFGGWAHDISKYDPVIGPVPNLERNAWDNNYVILETKGRGHYIGCNLSVTNFKGEWWGEGDDMIWVDGYKWPPDLHGTGSEDYLNQAWGVQPVAFQRCGTTLYEPHTQGYQCNYVFHLENPVRFQREIKVTIEHGHANHLANEMSSTAYWYAAEPTRVARVPAVAKRLPVRRDNQGRWLHEKKNQATSRQVDLTPEMKDARRHHEESRKP